MHTFLHAEDEQEKEPEDGEVTTDRSLKVGFLSDLEAHWHTENIQIRNKAHIFLFIN